MHKTSEITSSPLLGRDPPKRRHVSEPAFRSLDAGQTERVDECSPGSLCTRISSCALHRRLYSGKWQPHTIQSIAAPLCQKYVLRAASDPQSNCAQAHPASPAPQRHPKPPDHPPTGPQLSVPHAFFWPPHTGVPWTGIEASDPERIVAFDSVCTCARRAMAKLMHPPATTRQGSRGVSRRLPKRVTNLYRSTCWGVGSQKF